MLIDSHCHLSSDEIYQDLENVIKRAKENGVDCFLNAASKFDELDLQLQISSSFSNIWTMTGVHPHDALSYASVSLEEVLEKTKHEKVIAIGECGLDYFYDFAPKDVQINVFKTMIKASQESGLPIVVHSRDAEDDTIELLKSAYKLKPFKGVIHCYSSNWKLAEEALKMGFYISASGMITFRNAADLRGSFEKIPLNRLLVETDTPYLAPVPMRGKINEPAYVAYTAHALADLKKVSYEKIAEITTNNFFDLFSKAKKND